MTAPVRHPPARAARASWTAHFTRPGFWRGVAAAVAAGVFMALAGAFGTGEAPLLRRVAYWVVLFVLGVFAGNVAARLVDRWAAFDERPWTARAILAVLISIPATLAVMGATAALFRHPIHLAELPSLYPTVLLISVVMTALIHSVQRMPQTHAAAEGAPPPKFLDRLPPKLRGAELYAVEAEDHYLRLHTSLGQDLILLRLSDAIAELEGIEGAQVHRSWWVARAAVASAERGDGRAVLTLKDGAQTPVSRSYAKALRAEGWF